MITKNKLGDGKAKVSTGGMKDSPTRNLLGLKPSGSIKVNGVLGARASAPVLTGFKSQEALDQLKQGKELVTISSGKKTKPRGSDSESPSKQGMTF
jgi:hypothetical protein